ncbi:MAG: alkene reductase [Candidatus Thiodiazotropha sp.]
MSGKLFESFELGPTKLRNRVVMAPMTRCRATADHLPTPLMATYYGQRAEAGLIISEAVGVSPNGLGYARMPGLYNQTHVDAWRQTTDAVHERNGRIFAQLIHTGRVSHPLNMPDGARVLAPSPIALTDGIWTDQEGMRPCPTPTPMSEEDIQQTIEAFATSAELAIAAGFDGVEVHSANGYLLDEFLNTASNQRTDRWGGTIENRARLSIEAAKAVSARIGAQRTGIRISPYGVFNEMVANEEMDDLYIHLANACAELGLIYTHISDFSAQGAPEVPPAIKQKIRESFGGTYILSGGYDAERANADLAAGKCDLIAIGRPFIANPDLIHRFKNEISLNTPDPDSFYTPDEKGYTDYPLATS